MIQYLAVMRDETYCEFSVEFEAFDRSAAYEYLREQYPESTIIQVESPEDRRDRETAVYHRANSWYENPDHDDFY